MVAWVVSPTNPEPEPWRLPRRKPDVAPGTPIWRLLAAIDEVCAEAPASSTAGLGDDLRALYLGINRLEADAARRLARFESAREYEAEQHSCARTWVGVECGMSAGASALRVTVARRLPELPETWASFRAGEIGIQNAACAARLVTDVGAEPLLAGAGIDRVSTYDRLLAGTASDHTPERFRRVVAHIRHAVDEDGAVATANDLYERRRLHLSQTLDGMWVLDALLDPETGDCLKTALEAVMPGRRDKDRTAAQRRADGLKEITRRVRDTGKLENHRGQRTHVTVIVGEATLRGERGVPGAELGWAGMIPGETARRLACDASISTIRLVADGEPEQVGPTRAAIPLRVWRALVVRDGGCRFPGCEMPACWADAHHIRHRAHGGPTKLENLVVLCRRHHRAVHEGGWKIVQGRRGGFDVVPP